MNKVSNKSKLLLPIATIAISSSTIVLANVIVNDKDNNNLDKIELKSISNNVNQKNNLTNPNELFYLSSKLDKSVDPWDSTNDKKNEANVKKWQDFYDNLNKIAGNSTAKDDLLEVARQVIGVATLKDFYKVIDNYAKDNPFLTPEVIQSMKDSLKEESGFKESIDDVNGLDTIIEKLLSISGISEGTKMSLNVSSITITDLAKSQGTSTLQTGDIGSVAGQDYKQLIKIAEIDPSTKGNYALSFKWRKSNSSASVSGNLIIKNNAEQLTNNKDDLSKLISSLDVFGRWNLGANGSIGAGGYNKEMENFILQPKINGDKTTIEVLVRLKTGESFSDLQWATDSLLPGASNLAKGTKFGILDIQADQNSTFKSKILGSNSSTPQFYADEEYSLDGKLVKDINDAKLIKKISFFSDSLTSKVAKGEETAPGTGFISSKANRKVEFYQYENVNISLPLYYAVASQSDATSKSYSYAPINIFTNGVDSKVQQTISLESPVGDATEISPASYNMFSDLKNALPDEAKKDFQDSSRIQLVSTYNTSSKFAEQKLIFYDGFYAIGNRDEGWSSVDTSDDIKMIRISDPTEKIFAEKPIPTQNGGIKKAVSGIYAQETVNERVAVLGLLSNVYEQFSKSNSGDFEGINYGNFTTGNWVAKGPNNSNIVFENVSVGGSANSIYKSLNNSWSKLSPIMNKLFPGLGTNEKRYTVSETNSSKSIVESYLAFVSQFSVNVSQLEAEISSAINAIKEQFSQITETTTYDKLNETTKRKLGSIMVELIKIQFGTINNEFMLRLNTPIYDSLVKAIDNVDNKINVSINTPSSFLSQRDVPKGPTGLIYYSENGFNNIINEGEVSIKSAVESIFNLMYYTLDSNTYLGTAIYGATKSTNSTDLLNIFQSMNPKSLTSFESDVFSTQRDKIQIYNKLFSIFTNIDLQSNVSEMLRTGNAISIDNLSNKIKTGIVETIQKLSGKITRGDKAVSSEIVNTFYMDDLLSGANAIISLKWRLNNLNNENSNNNEIKRKIIEILRTNDQISSYELSTWSNIIKSSYNYKTYSSEFSGRSGVNAVDAIALKLVQDSSIMAIRSKDSIAAAVVLEKIVSYAWWIIVALIGVGVLVSSTIGIATKDQRIKLSSRPILKWILISGIVLGLGIVGIALAIGIPPILI